MPPQNCRDNLGLACSSLNLLPRFELPAAAACPCAASRLASGCSPLTNHRSACAQPRASRSHLAHGRTPRRHRYACPRLLVGMAGLPNDPASVTALQTAAELGAWAVDCADIYPGSEALARAAGSRLVKSSLSQHPARRLGCRHSPLSSWVSPLATLHSRPVALWRTQVHTKFVPDESTLASLDAAAVRAAVLRSTSRLGRVSAGNSHHGNSHRDNSHHQLSCTAAAEWGSAVQAPHAVQLHWWGEPDSQLAAVAAGLEAARAGGLLRAVGVTNMSVPYLEVVTAHARVGLCQVALSLLDRRPLEGKDDETVLPCCPSPTRPHVVQPTPARSRRNLCLCRR